jgi:hypothetical protein
MAARRGMNGEASAVVGAESSVSRDRARIPRIAQAL